LAILALSQYLAGNTREKELNDKLLAKLRQPLSYGHWIGLLRDVMAFIRAHQEIVFIC
jgi:hypothetical protein